MIDRHRNDDDLLWDQCQRLIQSLEAKAREPSTSPADTHDFLSELASGLRQTTAADAAIVRLQSEAASTTIVCDPIALISGDENKHESISASSSAGGNDLLHVEARFHQPVPLARRQAIEQLVSVLSDLAIAPYMRGKIQSLAARLKDQDDRDDWIAEMHQGTHLTESFAAIASATSRRLSIDRISLLRVKAKTKAVRLVATSTHSTIDRRAHDVQALRQLARLTIQRESSIRHSIGANSRSTDEASEVLDAYIDHSGCREILLQPIFGPDDHDPIAVIALEMFRISTDGPQSLTQAWDTVDAPVTGAIQQAIVRHESALSSVAMQWFDFATTRKRTTAVAVAAAIAIAGWFPVAFDVPVEGKVVASNQSRIFAPTEAIVTEVFVSDGQHISAGQKLMALRSPQLDLDQQAIIAQLESAKAKRDSIAALRSSGGRDAKSSADQQTLDAEIAGLMRQRDAIDDQRQQLIVTSPIDGIVDHWNMDTSLARRPVSHGQYLLSVISPADGWNAEIEIPDQSIAHVAGTQNKGPTRCSLKLRSDPTQTIAGSIDRVSGVADVNAAGKSVVRAIVSIESGDGSAMRQGASVVARIHCGKRSAAFVYLQSFIQWYRQQSWF
ncbi:HlyD family secretion protein [Rubripirellula tenax]|uniref:HlyD family secretion protein n=1 Tax=Rubripirellula tenax TaxID=2528015 RepID=A0A5C6F2J1_9BACT|nr:biotin/lipoyl-binding protein [Rubripirellula tenax]TWU54577.1 HlyD family secretion protein [Rubripirellula tenax]